MLHDLKGLFPPKGFGGLSRHPPEGSRSRSLHVSRPFKRGGGGEKGTSAFRWPFVTSMPICFTQCRVQSRRLGEIHAMSYFPGFCTTPLLEVRDTDSCRDVVMVLLIHPQLPNKHCLNPYPVKLCSVFTRSAEIAKNVCGFKVSSVPTGSDISSPGRHLIT